MRLADPSGGESDRPDLTPIVDVVFLLLIFFLAATVFDEEQFVVDVEMPETVDAGPVSNLRGPVVNITSKGAFIMSIGGERRKLKFEQVSQILDKYVADLPPTAARPVVQIVGDRRVPLAYPALVLGKCYELKLETKLFVKKADGRSMSQRKGGRSPSLAMGP